MDPEALLRLLIEQECIEPKDFDRLLEDYESGDRELFDFLEASGVGSKEEVLKIIAEAHGAEMVDLKTVEFPPRLFDTIPGDLLRIYRCIPIYDSIDLLKICLVDPLDTVAVGELRTLLGRPIEVVIADPDVVDALLQERLLKGSSFSSVSNKTAPVAASLGAKPDTQPNTLEQGRGGGTRMVGLALLAASASAAAALYLGQQYSAQAAKTLLEEFETFRETHRLSRLAWAQDVRDLEREIEQLATLLTRSEVDAIKLGQLEVGMQRLEGKLESLNEIKPSRASGDGAPEANDEISE
jgi:hypothetical protein